MSAALEASPALWVPDPQLWTPPAMPDGAAFAPGRALRAQRFFERALVHTKGRFARRPFDPRRWQLEEILWPLFGTVRWDDQQAAWVRQFTLAWIELARKNGKSDVMAGIALFMLTGDGLPDLDPENTGDPAVLDLDEGADGVWRLVDDPGLPWLPEEGGEIYGAAKKLDQAKIVFAVAKRMVDLSPHLQKEVRRGNLRIFERDLRMVWVPTETFYQCVPADAEGILGSNPYCVLFDEVLTQPNRLLWDALKTGMGARAQPMMVAATTAGTDVVGLASEEHLHSEQVRKARARRTVGEDVDDLDPSRFVFMRNAPKAADWRLEANWYEPNPALGDFLSLQTLRDEAKEAERSMTKQLAFRQFRLNQWVARAGDWLDMDAWSECGEPAWPELPTIVDGTPWCGGLDVAESADFAAWQLVFGDPADEEAAVVVLTRLVLPRRALERRSAMRPTLAAWEAEGSLIVSDAETISDSLLLGLIDRDVQAFGKPKAIGYDRWGAKSLVAAVRQAGVRCEGIAQTFYGMSDASKRLERLVSDRRLRHGAHPVLEWMAGNVIAEIDGQEHIRPDKRRSKEKIDGIVGTVNAIAAWSVELPDEGGNWALPGWS